MRTTLSWRSTRCPRWSNPLAMPGSSEQPLHALRSLGKRGDHPRRGARCLEQRLRLSQMAEDRALLGLRRLGGTNRLGQLVVDVGDRLLIDALVAGRLGHHTLAPLE